MENIQNRNDVYDFFAKMPKDLQLVAIDKQMRQKKPPDFVTIKNEGHKQSDTDRK